MQLILQSQIVGDAIVVRCSGRIVSGEESRLLQREVEAIPLPPSFSTIPSLPAAPVPRCREESGSSASARSASPRFR
jgi:hypothetical protein